MKKVLLGICLSLGASLLNAEDYSCTYNFEMAQKSVVKAGKALELELNDEAKRYLSDTKYHIKQVLINCDKNSEKWKAAKQAFDNEKKLDEANK